MTFTVQSLPGESFKGKISFIDPVIDPKTRVAKVRVEIRNRNNKLKPEMFARGQITASIPELKDAILIPRSAVLWTGKRAVVYVRDPEFKDPTFSYREIDLGQEAGAFYIVKNGLAVGEEIVTNGAFKIDAAAQLQGKPSMMNPEGGKISTGHNHGGANKNQKTTEHEGHNMNSGAMSSEMKESVDENFKKQLTEVYKAQLDLQKAFLATDAEKVFTEVSKVKSALKKVDMSLVKGEMHNHWMASMSDLNKSLDQMTASKEIEQQRLAYADFSDALYQAIKMFGTVGETIYYQFCPMAKNDKGAYWLSSTKEIKNPYFGDAMLTCGENKEVIQ
ncbi:MAG: efflux RND transporter periplasmic adaptor subunit [Bacteroidia bacterium]